MLSLLLLLLVTRSPMQPMHACMPRFGLECADALEWRSWQPGTEYTKNYVLKNVGTEALRLNYKQTASKSFSMDFPETIKLRPGMSHALKVQPRACGCSHAYMRAQGAMPDMRTHAHACRSCSDRSSCSSTVTTLRSSATTRRSLCWWRRTRLPPKSRSAAVAASRAAGCRARRGVLASAQQPRVRARGAATCRCVVKPGVARCLLKLLAISHKPALSVLHLTHTSRPHTFRAGLGFYF